MEHWLTGLGVTPSSNLHGSRWVEQVFKAMGEDPASGDYVRPGNGDVWDFVRRVCGWVETPTRDGIPGA